MNTKPCDCLHCTEERVKAHPIPTEHKIFGVIDPRLMHMFLCAICGNKRCPHATDHINPCTGSNEPGQKGSVYE